MKKYRKDINEIYSNKTENDDKKKRTHIFKQVYRTRPHSKGNARMMDIIQHSKQTIDLIVTPKIRNRLMITSTK